MVSRNLIYYYLAKRAFLFMDEWLFYFVLYKLFRSECYQTLIIVTLYGIGCIYTSYANISKIERLIVNIDQDLYILDLEGIVKNLNSLISV